MSVEMILFIGIQATGKSEFFKRNFYTSHMRINLDMLRTRRREEIFLDACFRAKQPFVVDNTNPTIESRREYIRQAKEAGFTVTGYYFKSAIADAIARNAQRTGKAKIPPAALAATHKKLELPAPDEGFDALHYVYIDENNEFIVEDYSDEV